MFRLEALFSLILITFLAGVLHAGQSPTAVVESHLDNQTIITAPASALPAALHACVTDAQNKAPSYVYAILAGGRTDADAIAPTIVASAIHSLSKPPSGVLISEIVQAAVKATPDAVLKIVRAAILNSPDEAGASIVKSAILAVKNPNGISEVASADSSGKQQTDYKGFKEFKEFKTVSQPEQDKSLADRIIQTAIQANPSLDLEALKVAVNQGLQIFANTPLENDSHFAIWPPLVPLVSQ